MVTICKDGSYVFENQNDVSSVAKHLEDFNMLCVEESFKVFSAMTDILLVPGKIKVILHKTRVLVENEGMAWEFNPENGWNLLGMY